MYCPQCHQKIEPFSTICPHCGHKSIIQVQEDREEQEEQATTPLAAKSNPFCQACQKMLLAAGALLLLFFFCFFLLTHR